MNAFLAQLQTPPIGDLGHWIWMLVASALLICALLHGWNEARKAFGRTPPIDASLAALETKIEKKIEVLAEHHLKSVEEVDRRRSVGVANAHAAADRHAAELRSEASTRVTELRSEMAGIKTQLGEIEQSAAVLDERSKTTSHKIDSMDQKIDKLLQGKRT